ncbi:hypothetical protein BGW80DRAFT_1263209 [Lactifluus volemus]|nr:hypothetical protein BGW80DRAFT_1263209 [Lactifluus volemus]
MPEPSPLTPLLSARSSLAAFSGPSFLWRTGALFVAMGMTMGAFGTHALRSISDFGPGKVDAVVTATRYMIFNGLGLCIISLHPRFSFHRFAGPAIALGGFIFSSSVIVIALSRNRLNALGPITPLGGMIMIAGYFSLAL